MLSANPKRIPVAIHSSQSAMTLLLTIVLVRLITRHNQPGKCSTERKTGLTPTLLRRPLWASQPNCARKKFIDRAQRKRITQNAKRSAPALRASLNLTLLVVSLVAGGSFPCSVTRPQAFPSFSGLATPIGLTPGRR